MINGGRQKKWSTFWKSRQRDGGRIPCAILTLNLLGEAGLMAFNLFSLPVHSILGGVSIFYNYFDYGLRIAHPLAFFYVLSYKDCPH